MNIPIVGNPITFEAHRYSVEQSLRTMAQLGYDQVELCHLQITDFNTPRLRGQLVEFIRSLGMEFVGSNVPNSDYFQALSSRDDIAGVLGGLKEDVNIAEQLGAKYLLTWEGRKPAGASRRDVFGWILEATVEIFREITACAAEKGMEIYLEIHPFTLGIDLEFAVQLCEGVGADTFGIAFDSCHFGVGLPDTYIEAVHTLGSRIKHVHFSDSDKQSSELHFAIGKGCLDLEGILGALRQIDFRGRWMLDLYKYPLPEEAVRAGMPYMREALKCFPDG